MALRVRELARCSDGYRSNPDGHETLQDWWCYFLIGQAAAESSLQKNILPHQPSEFTYKSKRDSKIEKTTTHYPPSQSIEPS